MDYYERSDEHYANATAIDPEGCGCTECLIGEYIPADRLRRVEDVTLLTRAANGELRNNMHTEADYQRLREEIGASIGIEVVKVAFPGAIAVDPSICGCTECLIGLYIPLTRFLDEAEAGDLQRLKDGELSWHTHEMSIEAAIEKICDNLASSYWG